MSTYSSSRSQSVLKPPNRASPSISNTPPPIQTPTTSLLLPRVSILKDALESALFNSFCDLSFNVLLGGKLMDKVHKILQLFITTLSKIDDSVLIVQFN